MSPKSTLLLLAAAATLSACVGVIDGGPIDRGPNLAGMGPAQCVAANAKEYLGQEVQDHTVDEARAHAGALRSRVIRPGEPVTMDSDPLRLNIELDPGNRIRRLRCG